MPYPSDVSSRGPEQSGERTPQAPDALKTIGDPIALQARAPHLARRPGRPRGHPPESPLTATHIDPDCGERERERERAPEREGERERDRQTDVDGYVSMPSNPIQPSRCEGAVAGRLRDEGIHIAHAAARALHARPPACPSQRACHGCASMSVAVVSWIGDHVWAINGHMCHSKGLQPTCLS